jgi:hypothetical protein
MAKYTARMNSPLENNPIRHIQKIKTQMRLIISQLGEDVGKVTEARARALFRTSADVLAGLVKAYDDYEKKSQTASRNKLIASLPKGKFTHASRG